MRFYTATDLSSPTLTEAYLVSDGLF